MLSIFKKKSTKELIYSNELEKLQKRINPSNVNLIDEDGRTALYYAIQANNTQAASFLLNMNADAHLASSSKENPVIHDVIKTFNSALLQIFLCSGERLPSTINDEPILHHCIQNNCRNYSFLDTLIQNNCDPNQLNKSGRTVLAEALTNTHTDFRLVEFLLSKGVDINRASDKENTPIYCLIFNYSKPESEKVHLFNSLINHIKQLSEEDTDKIIQHIINKKLVALFLCFLSNTTKLNLSIDATLQDFLTPQYFTPANQKLLIKVIKERNLQLPVSIEILKAQGETALNVSLTPRMAFKLAINTEANMDEKRNQLSKFYSKGEDIDTPHDWKGKSLSSLQALILEHSESPRVNQHVELLLSLGAKCENNGQSALLFAARSHAKHLIEFLLQNGANPLFVSEDGESFFSELTNKDTKASTLHFFSTLLHILERIGSILSNSQMNELLYSSFKYKKDENILLMSWALLQKSNDCFKLITLLLQNPFNWDIEKCFISAYGKNKPLLAHLLEIKDDDLIEFFFQQNPSYKIPLGHGFFNRALLNNLHLNTLKHIVNHTEDLSKKDTIELNWENYKEHKFNYLVSLAYNYDAKTNNDKEKYIELAHYLIKKGVDLNQVGDMVTRGEKTAAWITGTTFLIECVEANFIELFELGLEMGADPSVRVNANNDTFTLTTCGRYKENFDVLLIPFLEKLKERGFTEINTPNDIGKTPVIAAAQICNYNVLEWFIKEGGDINVVGGFNNTTPIISAIVNWPDINSNIRTKTVEILLNHGADINQPDSEGETPLMNAAYYGALSVVELLLSRDANVHAVDPQGRNAVIHAVQGAYDYQYRKEGSMNEHIKAKILKLLVDKGADLNIIPHEHYPALTHVINQNYKLLYSSLINWGISVNCADKEGITSLMYAIVWGHAQAVHALLKHKDIDLNATNNYGENLWHIVSYSQNKNNISAVVKVLIEKEIKLGHDKTGRHPLHVAVINNQQDLMKTLLQLENCINTTDHENNTPLMYTAFADSHHLDAKSRLDIAQLLIDHGADINALNTLGNSVLKISQNSKNEQLTNLLIMNGADESKGRRKIGFGN